MVESGPELNEDCSRLFDSEPARRQGGKNLGVRHRRTGGRLRRKTEGAARVVSDCRPPFGERARVKVLVGPPRTAERLG